MNKKLILPILFFFLLVVPVYAVSPFIESEGTLSIAWNPDLYIQEDTDFILGFHVFNSTGYSLTNDSANCSIHSYYPNGSGFSLPAEYNSVTHSFYINLTAEMNSERGILSGMVHCENGGEAGWLTGIAKITKDGQIPLELTSTHSVIILLPLLFGLICLFGAATLDEEHTALKIGLFLFSFITIFMSLHIGTIFLTYSKYMPDVDEWIGNTTLWLGIFLFVIITYIGFYAFYKMSLHAKQKKNERLKY